MTLATHPSPILFTRGEIAFAKLRCMYRRWRAARQNRALAAALGDRQLADAGLNRVALNGNAPVAEVPASVVAVLMSLR